MTLYYPSFGPALIRQLAEDQDNGAEEKEQERRGPHTNIPQEPATA